MVTKNSIAEMHWLMDMLQNIDIGLVVVDRDYGIQVWNNFMVNHSGVVAASVIGKNIFDRFKDLQEDWFRRKIDSVFLLNNRAFITWEQRDYLFKFKNYRPITGIAEYMYQNITLIPLASSDGNINHVGVIIYDVTDIATGKTLLQQANKQLKLLSQTDALTGLNNRGHWEVCLEQEYRRAKRTGQFGTLVIFDIDHFKKVNDTFGHQAGDEVIRNVSSILTDSKRTTDIAGRYGGEEFTLLLIDTSATDARVFTERFRQKIEKVTVRHEQHQINYTISLGIAELDASMKDHMQWLECADKALYQAKNSGRNCSVIFSEGV